MNFLELPMLRHPLIQAPMAGVQGADLAVAVSEAGGLGSLPGAMLGPEQLQAELESITRRTDKPYNVNFFCHRLPTVDDRREARWQECFSSYYREFSVEPPKDSGPGRRPFDSAIADVIEPFKPPVVSFHFGLPDPALVERVKAWGGSPIVYLQGGDDAEAMASEHFQRLVHNAVRWVSSAQAREWARGVSG